MPEALARPSRWRQIGIWCLPYLFLLGIVLWLGGTRDAPARKTTARADVPAASAVISGSTDKASSSAAAEKPAATPLRKVELTAAERTMVEGEFFKAADKDLQRLQNDIETARKNGRPAADIQAMEARLQVMQQMMQDVRRRQQG